MFLSFNGSLSQHRDSDEPGPTIGLWGNIGPGQVNGGEFVFSQRNLALSMDPRGTLVVWFGQLEEHGTAMLTANDAMRCAVALGRKGEFEIIREENNFEMQ